MNILELINRIENIEDFIKVEYSHGRVSEQTTNELLRLTEDIINIGLETC